MAYFLLPLLRGGFGLGAVFGLCVCLLGLLLLVCFGKLSRRGGWRKLLARVAAVCYCLGLCWAGYLTALMLSATANTPPAGTPWWCWAPCLQRRAHERQPLQPGGQGL